jgi:predicted metal-binding protein
VSRWDGDLRVEPGAPGAPARRAELIVCATCETRAPEPLVAHRQRAHTESAQGESAQGESDGARLLEQLRGGLAALPPARAPALALGSIECLWACARSCTVHLRAAGRMGYVLGGFAPDAAAARVLLDFAALYCASEDGVVLYPHWPAGLRGHFVCRVPPASAARTVQEARA